MVEETIEVGAYGLGPPIAIWEVTRAGVKRLDDGEPDALAATAHDLREKEIQLLLGV